jgi:hypothetical protein
VTVKDKTASLCNMYLNDLLKTDKVLAHKSIVVAIQIFATTLRRPRESVRCELVPTIGSPNIDRLRGSSAHVSVVVKWTIGVRLHELNLIRSAESGCYDSSAKHLGPLVA